MFKLDRKFLAALSISAASFLAIGCNGDTSADANTHMSSSATQSVYANGKAVIDGGVVYPVVNGKTAQYLVNEDAHKGGYNYGRTPTANELKAWNTDVTPWKLPPKGQGSVEEGEELYEAQCVMCHGDFGSGGGGYPALSKGNAYDLQKTLKNQRVIPDADGPVRVFGSYWPQASTLWWYIHDGMPHPKTKSLTPDEVYALTAYIVSINEIKIDGEELDDEYVLDQEKFSKIVMPNVDGFEPKIDGKGATDVVRAYYADPKNFGAQNLKKGAVRCMSNCQKETAKVVHIQGAGIADFLPPMNTVRDMPKAEGAPTPGKKDYEASCAVCHADSSMGAPAFGDKAAWAKVTAQGIETVYQNAINGKNGMPPKGGTDLADDKIKDIVNYMVNSSK